VGRTILAIHPSECPTELLEKVVKQYNNEMMVSSENNGGACVISAWTQVKLVAGGGGVGVTN